MSDPTPVPATRRWARRLKALVLGLAVLLIVLLLGHIGYDRLTSRRLDRMERDVEGEIGPLALSRIRPAKVPDADNRAPVVAAAATLVRLDDDERDQLGGLVAYMDDAKLDEQRAMVDAMLARNGLTFQVAEAAAALPAANWDIQYEEGTETRLPDLLKLITLDRLLVLRAWVATRDGRVDEALASLDTAAAISTSMKQEPILIMQMIRRALDRQHLALVRRLLSGAPTPHVLDRLARIIDGTASADALPDALVADMIVEHRVVREILAGGPARADVYPTVVASLWTRWFVAPMLKNEETERLDCLRAASQQGRRPRFERGSLERCGVEQPGWTYRWARFPNLDSVLLRNDLAIAGRSLAELSLSVVRYRASAGAYPADLAALVPGQLAAIPVDPFTGKPFVYERRDDGFVLTGKIPEEEKTLAIRVDRLLRWEIRE